MTNIEFFCCALDTYVQFPKREHAQELHRACGKVWSVSAQMPINARPDVEVTIGNYVEFDQWERNGRTYAGAAQRIRPVLEKEHGLN
ncbi:hypothetical protein ATO6_12330 [Oceanicola sp. 22II-s10i]|uniref:hypothetical protein n=1 Tax=Oceanicola sp. 22II-s10i TaxID=1317116 RepID=UPI000B5230EF|nr:hypothetical protein [Oceanicola sp. 22II-s10i]OWU84473.1 hypothetical protein ATO6_12330 [Oceanicola sp. 22II-s10i]